MKKIEIAKAPNINVVVSFSEKGLLQASSLNLSEGGFWLYFEKECDQLENICAYLRSYAAKKESMVKIQLEEVNFAPFSRATFDAMSKVPFGQTISYQELASRAGNKLAARVAGSVCRKNPFPLFIPCHRIVQLKNNLYSFSQGKEIKKELLFFEK